MSLQEIIPEKRTLPFSLQPTTIFKGFQIEIFAQFGKRIPEARIGDLGTDFKSVPLHPVPAALARRVRVGKCPARGGITILKVI
jgi:hypothetical protein